MGRTVLYQQKVSNAGQQPDGSFLNEATDWVRVELVKWTDGEWEIVVLEIVAWVNNDIHTDECLVIDKGREQPDWYHVRRAIREFDLEVMKHPYPLAAKI